MEVVLLVAGLLAIAIVLYIFFICAGKASFDESEVFGLQRSRRLDDGALVRCVWP